MEELEARVTALESEMRTRVSAVENEVRTVRMDAAAARVLAGGADRDVSAFGAKLDAQKALLEALRETQVEQGHKIDRLGTRIDGHDARFDSLEGEMRTRFASLEGEMRTGFAKLAAGQSVITTLLEGLIDQNPDKA